MTAVAQSPRELTGYLDELVTRLEALDLHVVFWLREQVRNRIEEERE